MWCSCHKWNAKVNLILFISIHIVSNLFFTITVGHYLIQECCEQDSRDPSLKQTYMCIDCWWAICWCRETTVNQVLIFDCIIKAKMNEKMLLHVVYIRYIIHTWLFWQHWKELLFIVLITTAVYAVLFVLYWQCDP